MKTSCRLLSLLWFPGRRYSDGHMILCCWSESFLDLRRETKSKNQNWAACVLKSPLLKTGWVTEGTTLLYPGIWEMRASAFLVVHLLQLPAAGFWLKALLCQRTCRISFMGLRALHPNLPTRIPKGGLPHGLPSGGLVDTQSRQNLQAEALRSCANLAFKSTRGSSVWCRKAGPAPAATSFQWERFERPSCGMFGGYCGPSASTPPPSKLPNKQEWGLGGLALQDPSSCPSPPPDCALECPM